MGFYDICSDDAIVQSDAFGRTAEQDYLATHGRKYVGAIMPCHMRTRGND